MQKTIMITGATDGIGLETARLFKSRGHHLLLHGRNQSKLDAVVSSLMASPGEGRVNGLLADLSRLPEVDAMADAVMQQHDSLDVLINNAGIFKTKEPVTDDGLDVRFVVNTLAPYLLTRKLMPLIGDAGRVINVSSAAQAPVSLEALAGRETLEAMDAYAQSKFALTMWSIELSKRPGTPVVVAVNPGSLLGSKMVKEGFGVAGGDLKIGADILSRAALDAEFQSATGLYFDNDSGSFAAPHADAADPDKVVGVVRAIESVIARLIEHDAAL